MDHFHRITLTNERSQAKRCVYLNPLCRMCVWQCELINQLTICPTLTPETHTHAHSYFICFTKLSICCFGASLRLRLFRQTHGKQTQWSPLHLLHAHIQNYTYTNSQHCSHSWCLCAARNEEWEVTHLRCAAYGSSISTECVMCCTQCNCYVYRMCEHYGKHCTWRHIQTLCCLCNSLCYIHPGSHTYIRTHIDV